MLTPKETVNPKMQDAIEARGAFAFCDEDMAGFGA